MLSSSALNGNIFRQISGKYGTHGVLDGDGEAVVVEGLVVEVDGELVDVVELIEVEIEVGVLVVVDDADVVYDVDVDIAVEESVVPVGPAVLCKIELDVVTTWVLDGAVELDISPMESDVRLVDTAVELVSEPVGKEHARS